MNKCCKCKDFKPFEDFYPNKNSKRGCTQWCRNCFSIENKKRYKNKSKEIKYKVKQYRANNKEKCALSCKLYRENNKEKFKISKRIYEKNRLKNDISFKIRKNISRTINLSLSNKNNASWLQFVDYSLEELKLNFESKFKEGMSWDNYGKNGWVIDHKLPRELFPYISMDDILFKYCWELRNLYAIWHIENSKKRDLLPNGKYARNMNLEEKILYLKELGYNI